MAKMDTHTKIEAAST